MKKLLVASSNAGKIAELQQSNPEWSLASYKKDYPLLTINEVGATYEENAYLKAKTVSKIAKVPVLGDDGGLELTAFPDLLGVETARFFAPGLTASEKNQQLLDLLAASHDRRCTLVASLVYYDGQKILTVTKHLAGEIALKPRGQGGYGFDHIFYLPEESATLAELSEEERQKYSPRIQAFLEITRRVTDVS